MTAPLVVIVTGLPCSGKTALGRRISSAFSMPFISKDGFKERLFDTLGWSDRTWSKKLSAASYAMIFHMLEVLLSTGHSCVVEANFDPSVHSEPLAKITRAHGAQVLQVQCVTEASVLLSRFRARWERGDRHPGHADHVTLPEMERLVQQPIPPLELEGTVWTLDTTELEALETDALFDAIAKLLARDRV